MARPAVNEHRIIAKVIYEQDMQALLDRRVDETWFANPKYREAMAFISRHLDKYGRIPTRGTFISQMPTLTVFPVDESMDYLLDKQAEFCRWQGAKRMLPDVEDLLNAGKVEDAISAIGEWQARIDMFQPVKSRLVDSMHPDRIVQRWEEYLDREDGKSRIVGLETGFPTVDEATLGLQPGQLVTVLAQAKVGKTTLCLAMGNHIWSVYDEPILFVSFEMGIREMEMRQESLMAGVNFKHLQSGQLVPLEKKKYRQYMEKRADAEGPPPFHFMDANTGFTVSAIRSQADRLDPAVIILDGIYMMVDEVTGESNTAQSLTNITRSLKRLATHLQKPIVINTQALAWKSKGRRITMDSAGYSSSFSQDSDVILGLERVQDQSGKKDSDEPDQRLLRVLASRNTGLTDVALFFSYDEGMIKEMD